MGVCGLLALRRVDELEEELNRLKKEHKKEQGLTDQSESDTDKMQITENDMKALFATIACVVGVALIAGIGLVLWSALH
jgi:hypothetical protein